MKISWKKLGRAVGYAKSLQNFAWLLGLAGLLGSLIPWRFLVFGAGVMAATSALLILLARFSQGQFRRAVYEAWLSGGLSVVLMFSPITVETGPTLYAIAFLVWAVSGCLCLSPFFLYDRWQERAKGRKA